MWRAMLTTAKVDKELFGKLVRLTHIVVTAAKQIATIHIYLYK